MGSGKMGKKDDDSEAQTSSVNSLNKDGQMNLVMVGGIFMIVLAMIGWLMNERSALQQETVSLHNELEGYSNDKMGGDLANLGFSDGGKDEAVHRVMQLDSENFTAPAPAPASQNETAVGPAAAEDNTASAEACEDFSPQCAEWARNGECLTNKDWMVGTGDGFAGKCRKSCGECDDDKGAGGEAGSAPDGESETNTQSFPHDASPASDPQESASATPAAPSSSSSSSSSSAPAEGPAAAAKPCQDLSSNCKTWSLHGECDRNPEYMIGGDGYEGQCPMSCGKCFGGADDAAPPVMNAFDERMKNAVSREQNAVRPLRWPAKQSAQGRMCIGLSTSPCARGLYDQQNVELMDPADRSVQKGIGGPTGCTEAWATLVSKDEQIAGVLVMLYTLRYYATDDRDIVVLVTSAVSDHVVRQLLMACVVVKKVTEPMDPATHMGFVKLTLWLSVEYSKVVFVEYDAWIRQDPGEVFAFNAPAAIKTAPHARLMNEMFGSYFFVLEPSRQTFYDMLGKVGSIDSAEVIDDKTVYTERLFFSGYFEKWYMIPSSMLEFQQDVVSTIIPELTNTRLRRVIKSMPPYTPETVIDFTLVQARGVFANLHVKPWHPGWRIPCAWECRYRKYHQLYEAMAAEWWMHYYNLIDLPVPTERGLYSLLEIHDPHQLYAKKEFEHCLNFNCEIPANYKPEEPAPVKKRVGKRGLLL